MQLTETALEPALRTNPIKFGIDKTDTPFYKLCGISTGTIRHITSGCS